MIDREDIAKACSDNDALAEEHGIDVFLRNSAVDAGGLVYVAEQRALRALMMEKGVNPNVPVPLKPQERRRMTHYTTLFMDGFAAGLRAAQKEGRMK